MYCPHCTKEVEVSRETTDPKGNGYQLMEEASCDECGEVILVQDADFGAMIDDVMARNDYE